jgi:FAD/FMN-containing dehydrogenase
MSMRDSKISRRGLLIGSTAAVAGRSASAKAFERPIINDASGLDPTPVAKHWIAHSGEGDVFVARLRSELKEAAAAHRPVAAALARHSMGGQSIPRDGTAITMTEARCEVNTVARTYRVSTGARWRDVITALDQIGYSPAVMQSNNDFGVGSTFCVNAHGWPVPYGPFGSTVRSVELMLADGSIVICSPTQNAELFRAAMGGYGLLGIVLGVEADMTENCLLQPHYDHVPAAAFAPIFLKRAEDPDVRMLYGRVSIAKHAFFSDSLIVSYMPLPTPDGGLPPAATSGPLTGVSQKIYRAQIGSELAKRARWIAETDIARLASSGVSTRNTLMNEPVSNLAGRDPARTDILHEYFVAPERFSEFIRACQDVIPSSNEEILNVTLRYVRPDAESMLAYAPVTRIAAVMSFSQLMTPSGEVGMMRMTEELIDRVVSIEGAFYLPYRLHARRDQVAKAYPKADEFVAKKRQYDPHLLFRNAMWETYFAA